MPRILFNTKWVSIKEVNNFQYLERKGRDSIAIMLLKIEDDKLKALIRKQPLNALRTSDNQSLKEILAECPITGSLDKENEDHIECTIREVKEEAGYDITKEDVISLGRYIVGTQTNEKCYMFTANVTNLVNSKPEGDGSEDEAASENEWVDFHKLKDYEYSGTLIIYNKLLQEIVLRCGELYSLLKYI